MAAEGPLDFKREKNDLPARGEVVGGALWRGRERGPPKADRQMKSANKGKRATIRRKKRLIVCNIKQGGEGARDAKKKLERKKSSDLLIAKRASGRGLLLRRGGAGWERL